MTGKDRRHQVRIHGYCKNCLARSHATDDCTSADVCQKCGWAHHTLLHLSPGAPVINQEGVGRNARTASQSRTSRHVPAAPAARSGRVRRSERTASFPRASAPAVRPESASRNLRTSSRQRQPRVRDRLGPYRRPQPPTRNPSQSTHRSSRGANANPKRILMGAVRALERLAASL